MPPRLIFLTSGSELHILSSEGLPFALAFELLFTGACKVPGVVSLFYVLSNYQIKNALVSANVFPLGLGQHLMSLRKELS